MERCFFCDLGQGRIEITDLVLENDEFFAIYDAAPANPGHEGHVLIIPRKHVVSYFEMDPEYRARLYEFEKEVKDMIDKKHDPDAYNFGINDGGAAGRTINHLHIHLIARYWGDEEDPRGGVRNIFSKRIVPEKAPEGYD